MTKESKTFNIPGYVSTKQAAKMLGVSNHRMYQYVKEGRLPVVQIGKAFMLRIEDVEQFQPHPSGRTRIKPPSWRVYRSRGTLLVTDIHVHVRPSKQKLLIEKLESIQTADRHTFPGSVARYVIKEDTTPTSVRILLVWKDTEMPGEIVRQRHMTAFQEELADVLDWETAHYQTNETIIHT